ncbi:Peptidoglycan/LPS O-acetylase OafA/YrhL, contains acyltransferase and SGNH-hydrolase domains [Streptomyces misionensis]|uniref:Peptidoglycan/LPS O-acetylase OafA/YrhL, contains acyltransferase and SGNH-hydrolase domains n=1 Tax=Streptomyces misionensis TaxID=67331 RepID=A0A1H4XC51_9ACTN|nr:acyltransferase [Streptomyces misionensis]SED02478.1 Peptidoglycan/LPS O-acetylase OafA/YrhL, contains acyltransferase and SGNH-hydrolase domains [Streptomyces misionensis]
MLEKAGTERPPAAAGQSRLPSLTGARFLAALGVFAYHLSREGVFADPGVDKALRYWASAAGAVGVSFFFVLSGFVLTWSARPGQRARTFWRRRVAKIYPNHLATFVLVAVVTWSTGVVVSAYQAPPALTDPSSWLPNLLLLQSWSPDARIFMTGNPVSWSLSCELLFYLSFPLLHRALLRLDSRRLWAVVGVCTAVVLLLPALAGLLPERPQLPFAPIGEARYWFVYAFPLTRSVEFLLGMAAARLVMAGRWVRVPASAALPLLAAGYVLALHLPVLYAQAAATVIPLTLLIGALARRDADGRGSALSGRTFVWLGEVSFAFYMVHRLVLIYGHHLLGYGRGWALPQALALTAAAFALALLGSWLLYRAVEIPAMRKFGRSPATAPAVPRPRAEVRPRVPERNP